LSGYLPAIGAKEIEPLEMVDRVIQAAVETHEGPEGLRRAIWRDESGAEVWIHLQGEAPQTTTVIFRGADRLTGRLSGFSPPVDGPLNGQILVTEAEPALAPRLVLDLAEYGDAVSSVCVGRRVSVGMAALLTEGQCFGDRSAYLAACSRRGDSGAPGAPPAVLMPVGLRPQGDKPSATLAGIVSEVEERRNSLTGEPFLALTVEWDDQELQIAANPVDIRGEGPRPGAYLAARVWLVGYNLKYATPVPAEPAALPVGPGSVAAFAGWNDYLQLLQVTRIDKVPPGAFVVHMRVFAELFADLEALQAHQGNRQIAISHLALDAGALLDSDVMVLGTAALEAVDEAAYQTWRQAFERGEAGVFAVPLDQVMHLLANVQAGAEAPPDAPPDPAEQPTIQAESD
jgi:hypothetical protein